MNSADTAREAPQRLATIIVISLLPMLIGFAAVYGATIAVTGSTVTATVTRSAAGWWLAVHQVPILIRRAPLGFEPLLPTLLAAVMVALFAWWSARRLGAEPVEQAWRIVTVYAVGNGFLAVIMALIVSGDTVSVSLTRAFLISGIIAGLAAFAGVGWRSRGAVWLGWARPEVWTGIRAGLLASAALIVAGTVTVLVALAMSYQRILRVYDYAAGDLGGQLGQTLLSIGYLPNAAVSGASVLVGSGFSFGAAQVGPLSVTPGRIPPVPLLAALPESAPSWLVLVFAVPALIGVGVGRYCLRAHGDVRMGTRAVAVASVTAAVMCLLFAAVAGGQLGRGPFNPVLISPVLLAMSVLSWIIVCGVLALLPELFGGLGRFRGRLARRPQEAEEHIEPMVEPRSVPPVAVATTPACPPPPVARPEDIPPQVIRSVTPPPADVSEPPPPVSQDEVERGSRRGGATRFVAPPPGPTVVPAPRPTSEEEDTRIPAE